MKKICMLNQGCSGHFSEFRKLLNSLENYYELTNFPGNADVIVQYFCSIAQVQIAKICNELAYLSKIKKKDSILIICGCATESLGKEIFANLEFVNYVIGRENISENILKLLGYESIPGYYLGDYPTSFYIDIVGGCRKKGGWCSFCKQHYMKIPIKSIKMEEILQQIADITKTGNIYRIILGGLNTCNYGIDMDGKPKLHLLIRKISEIPEVKVIDIYSLTVVDMYEELIEEISTNNKIQIVELGIQSACNPMLKIMNTSSTKEKIQVLLNKFSHKCLKSIFVVGHPGETREYLKETLDFIVKNNLWYIQVSPYVNSEGTPSYDMEQLSKKEYDYHVKIAQETVQNLRKKFLDNLIGSTMSAYWIKSEIDSQDTIDIYMIAKDLHIYFLLTVENYSTSKYATFFEKMEIHELIPIKIRKVLNYDEPLLGIDLVEA